MERKKKHTLFIIYKLHKNRHHFFFLTSSTQLSGSQVIPLLLLYCPTTMVSTGTIFSSCYLIAQALQTHFVHPRRPRGCQMGRCDIFRRKFTSRATKSKRKLSFQLTAPGSLRMHFVLLVKRITQARQRLWFLLIKNCHHVCEHPFYNSRMLQLSYRSQKLNNCIRRSGTQA